MAPDGAVGAVAADQIAPQFAGARRGSERREDPVLIVAVGQQLGSPLHRQSLASQVRDQRRFDLRLAQDEQKRIGRIVEVEARERTVTSRSPRCSCTWAAWSPRSSSACVTAIGRSTLQGAWLDDQGSGRTARYAASIDNPDRGAEGSQLGGEG